MHPNTRLTPFTRERMLKEHLQEGTPVCTLAKHYGISRTTFYRWLRRYRLLGPAGLRNHSSRPRRILRRLSPEEVSQLTELRKQTCFGPLRLAPLLGACPATLYRCLRADGQGRLPRPPRPPVVRYEAEAPGALVHLDVLHLFALKGHKPAYQFTLVDSYSRMAYACITQRHTTEVALEVVRQASAFLGFPIQRILTDNDVTFAWVPRRNWHRGPPAEGTRFTQTLRSWGIRHTLTRIRRPQTNGKVERFHRTIQEELYRPHALFLSEEERMEALAHYLTYYNTQRYHTALGGLTPVQRRDRFQQEVSTTS